VPNQGPPNTADELRRRRSPNGEREAAAATIPLPARPPRGAVSSIRLFYGSLAAPFYGCIPVLAIWMAKATKTPTFQSAV
jgi:hypothetical protein